MPDLIMAIRYKVYPLQRSMNPGASKAKAEKLSLKIGFTFLYSYS